VKGTREDYTLLSHYHYRERYLGPYAAIYALKGKFRTAENLQTVGVIVYTMPAVCCRMRTAATGELLMELDKSSRLKLINRNFRTISRIIIEPRFRSLGLAARLVRETMPLMKVPFIEALAVMGRVNPFFEKAGMTCFDPEPSASVVRLIEALGAVGIEQQAFVDPRVVQQKINESRRPARNFVEREFVLFLRGYGKRRLMQPGIERARFVLSKLTDRPVYYLWRNAAIELRT
jgi:hypothetical protein